MSTRGSLFAGMISGTSMDGIDAALVRFGEHRCETVASATFAYPDSVRKMLVTAVADPDSIGLDELGQLDHAVGAAFRDAANSLLASAGVAPAEVSAIGSHGQTMRHRPDAQHRFSLQIGDPNLIAQGTGVTTVADFRRRDMAAGGEGAPLTPAFHHWLFADENQSRCVLNLGGIANLTILAAAGPVLGFDTGPANTLMDAWIHAKRGPRYDSNGDWAESGVVNEGLLNRLLADDYLQRPIPKSTGFEHFNLAWLNEHLHGMSAPAADVQATLLQFTVTSVADGVRKHAEHCTELLVCGGGVHNGALLSRLTEALSPLSVISTAAHGLDPDCVEAAAFAWLASQTLAHKPGNLPSVTGAETSEILGGIYLS